MKFPALLALLLLPALAWAQTSTLSGTATDASDGMPLPGVQINATQNGKLITSTRTDDRGAFNLTLPQPPGAPLTLTAALATYQTQTLQTTTGANGIAIAMPLITTDDVVITATKGLQQQAADLTVSLEVIKQQQINRLGTANIDRVMQQAAGVDVIDGQVNIRGSSGYAYGIGSRVMIMLNGLPLLTPEAAFPDLSTLPVDNIGQVEIIKGAGSVLYGSAALGGVINIITRDPGAKPQTVLRTKYTLYGAPQNRDLIWWAGRPPGTFSTHLFHARQIPLHGGAHIALTGQGDFIREDGFRRATAQKRERLFIMTQYHPKNQTGLSAGINFSYRRDSSQAFLYWKSYFPGIIPDPLGGAPDTTDGGLTGTDSDGAARSDLNRRIAIDPVLKYLFPNGSMATYRGRMYLVSNTNNTGQSSSSFLAFNDLLYQTPILGGKVHWTTGATAQSAFVNADSLYDGRKTGDSYGIYTQFDAKLNRWNFNLGARLESARIDTIPRESQPVFRAGANYQLAQGTNLRASWGQAFRVPTVAERYAQTTGGQVLVQPNPNLASERGFSAEIALRQAFKTGNDKHGLKGYLDLAAFSQNYDQMVEFGISDQVVINFTGDEPIQVPFSSRNIADARINGWEATAYAQFNHNPFFATLNGGITWLDPRNLNAAPDSLQINLQDFQALYDGGPDSLLLLLDYLNQGSDPSRIDAPSFLKYRSRWTIRASATLGLNLPKPGTALSLTANFRSQSFIQSVDQFLYVVVRDMKYFREKHPNGTQILDLALTYDATKNLALSLNLDNATNTEFAVIPGIIGEQRKYTAQLILRF